jgi:long-chain fatty acid transport protein
MSDIADSETERRESQMHRGLLMAGLCAAMQFAVSAWASGFAIREQSASFQGLSFAGVAAGGDDISTMFFNPATLARHDGTSLHISASYVAPTAEFELDRATAPGGGALTGSAGGDIAEDAIVPAVYGATSWGDVHVGIGVTAPFGLRTEQPANWVGRYHATESELTTVNVNPVLAYAVSDRLSVAAGFVAQYADATLANARDLSALAGAAQPSPATDGIATVSGDDWDYGFTLGVLAEPVDGTRIGVGYRSQINHSLEGDFTLASDVIATLRDSGRAAIATPQVASLGVRQRLTDEVDLLGTVEWTGWSSFDTLDVQLANLPDPPPTTESWNDSWFVALGAEYRPAADLAFTAGVAFDQSPIDDARRTPRIPGNDRTWLSVGVAWTPSAAVTVGGGYSRLFVADGDVRLDDADRGELRGSFDNAVDILAVHGTVRF